MAGQLLLGVSPWSCGCPEGSEGLDIQDALSHTQLPVGLAFWLEAQLGLGPACLEGLF